MAEVKHQFDGIAKATATLLFTSMAAGPFAFLTGGFLGHITFFILKRFSNWLANQGLALLNIGVDAIKIAQEKKKFDEEIDKAIKAVLEAKRKLTKEEQAAIDEPVKKAFRKFVSFV